MNIWNSLGFTQNPYSPRPVPGDETGASLLVGRDDELTQLQNYIASSDTHPTLEGSNGVGKTSLVAVAGYSLYKKWKTGDSQQALIPLKEPFQLTPDLQIAVFKRTVFFQVAQTFIDHWAAAGCVDTDLSF